MKNGAALSFIVDDRGHKPSLYLEVKVDICRRQAVKSVPGR